MTTAIQAATAAVMMLREAGTGPASGACTGNAGQVCRHRHGGPALRQPSFHCKVPDNYIELLSFDMEVMTLLQTRTYRLNEEEKVPTIKKLAKEVLQLIQIFISSEKRDMQNS